VTGIGRIAVGMTRQASTSSWRGTTRRAGARPSTRPGWSTHTRVRRERDGCARRGGVQHAAWEVLTKASLDG